MARAVNAKLTQLYWQIGRRINSELLQGQRTEYGKQVIAELARMLTIDFGKGWSERQLRYCLRVADIFPEPEILHTVCSQLSWSHLRLIIQIDNPLKRDFYLEICRLERWSVRQLQERINSLLYERTAISKKPEDTIRQDLDLLRDQGQLSPDLTFRAPYVLDFLGLSDRAIPKKTSNPPFWPNCNDSLSSLGVISPSWPGKSALPSTTVILHRFALLSPQAASSPWPALPRGEGGGSEMSRGISFPTAALFCKARLTKPSPLLDLNKA